MDDLLPFIVVGITNGSLFALAGMGLVLTYRSSGVFNFAHGAVGAAGAFCFYEMHNAHDIPWPIALVVAVGGVGVVFGFFLELLTRPVVGKPPAVAIVASVAVLLIIQGGISVIFGPLTRSVDPFLPTDTIEIADVAVQHGQIIIVVFGAVLAVGLYFLLKSTRLGRQMRAVVDDPALLGLAGADPRASRRAAWMIGSALATLAGILIAPSLGLDAVLLTLLIVQAFGACAIGRFSSLPMTYAGGIAVGTLVALASKYAATNSSFSTLPSAVPFIVLFVVLLVTPKGKLPTPRLDAVLSPSVLNWTRRQTATAGVLLAGVLLVLPELVSGARLQVFIRAASVVVLFLSLGLLVSVSRQVSLCHAAFVAVGATTFSHLTTGAGLPWLLALALAGLATVPLGIIVSIPSIRLSGVYLALATFGLGLLLQQVVYPWGIMFGVRGLRAAPRPDFGFLDAQSDRAYYFVCLALAVVAALAVAVVLGSRLGRLLRALADSPSALTSFGLTINITRVAVFCISAFLAGVSGALLIAGPGQITSVGFGPFESLTWVAIAAIAGRRPIAAGFTAAALLVVGPAYAPDSWLEYQQLIFGAVALIVTLAAQVDWRRYTAPARAERDPIFHRTPATAKEPDVAAPVDVTTEMEVLV